MIVSILQTFHEMQFFELIENINLLPPRKSHYHRSKVERNIPSASSSSTLLVTMVRITIHRCFVSVLVFNCPVNDDRFQRGQPPDQSSGTGNVRKKNYFQKHAKTSFI